MSQRILKVNNLLKEEISKLLQKEIQNGTFLTVTDVDTSPDLKRAEVWVSVYNREEEEAQKLLEEIAPSIQKALNKSLSLKYVPRIKFRIDKSPAHAARIEELLSQIKKEKESGNRS